MASRAAAGIKSHCSKKQGVTMISNFESSGGGGGGWWGVKELMEACASSEKSVSLMPRRLCVPFLCGSGRERRC